MEKAILKTLAYADIFEYPLKLPEIHKWLIGKKVTFRQVEKALGKLVQSEKCKAQRDYYFLQKKGLVAKRLRRQKQSAIFYKKAKLIAQTLKIIPWIKLVGVSGGLAMNNAFKKDDIDLIVLCAKKRLWLSRFFLLGLLSLAGQRRKRQDKGKKIAGKFCVNILLEEDKLEQKNKDIYVAHEILQMRVLWQRDGIYTKYLADNEWAFKFLPNWIHDARGPAGSVSRRAPSLTSFAAATRRDPSSPSPLAALLESFAKWLQLKIMQQPQGLERVEEGALYFHPLDYRREVLSDYENRLKKI